MSRSRIRSWISAAVFSSSMLAIQASAAPVMPMRGTSSRLRPILTITAPAALSRFHELLPPISSITVTLPVARLNSIPSDSTSSAELPATNSGPKMRSTTGPNTASVRYSGQHSVMIHQVPTW